LRGRPLGRFGCPSAASDFFVGGLALTAAAWEWCVAVPPGVPCQDDAGRLWDVLWMLWLAIGRSDGGRVMPFAVHVRNDHRDGTPPPVRLKAVAGPDDGAPCLTVMTPDED
jgi:hypothetical protein